jgi:hypothetical protein
MVKYFFEDSINSLCQHNIYIECHGTYQCNFVEGDYLIEEKTSLPCEGINCGFNHESGFQGSAYEILYLLLAVLSNGFEQGSIGISVNLDLQIPLCLMLMTLLFMGTNIRPKASLRGIFPPKLIHGIDRIDIYSFNMLNLLCFYSCKLMDRKGNTNI